MVCCCYYLGIRCHVFRKLPTNSDVELMGIGISLFCLCLYGYKANRLHFELNNMRFHKIERNILPCVHSFKSHY